VGWFNPVNIARVWSGIGVTTKTPSFAPRKLSECSFLSTGFVYSEEMKMFFPKPESDRVLCSLMYGSEINDVRWHYLRACALRLDSYWNEAVRVIISEYLVYLNRLFADQLVGVVNNVSFEVIRNMWKSDLWIEALYAGYETGRS
jgi:hypothetical protein